MAKYTVTHSCGHDQEHQLYGPGRDRERKLAWLETTQCSDCWREQRDTDRDEASAVAASQAEDEGLPELSGSAKQIAWAETIRMAVIKDLDAFEALVTENAKKAGKELPPDEWELWRRAVDEIRGETAARWWIDNRDEQGRNIAALVMRRLKQEKTPPTEQNMPRRRWVITADPEEFGVPSRLFEPDAKGGTPFALYDDDDVLCYRGRFYGDPADEGAFDPLYWAQDHAGCTYIKYRNAQTGCWEVL